MSASTSINNTLYVIVNLLTWQTVNTYVFVNACTPGRCGNRQDVFSIDDMQTYQTISLGINKVFLNINNKKGL